MVLITRPPEKLDVQYEEMKRHRPPPTGSIAVVPAGSSPLWRWQGSKDTLLIYLEPSLVARVAAESFEFDPTRTVVPPLDGLNVPELSSTMLAVDTELRGWRRWRAADGRIARHYPVRSLDPAYHRYASAAGVHHGKPRR